MRELTVRRMFSIQDNRRFAALSGDSNPLHVDPSYARRTMFGGAVAHGVHALLWAIEELWPSTNEPKELLRISGKFSAPIFVDRDITATARVAAADEMEIELECENALAAKILIEFASYHPHDFQPEVRRSVSPQKCRDRSFDELEGLESEIRVEFEERDAKEMFPKLFARLPSEQFAAIVSVTKLIGMESPGLNSILEAFDLEFGCFEGDHDALKYQVTTADRRFSKLVLRLEHAVVRGTVSAFYRPPPVQQPSYSEIAEQVSPREFSDQKALVVGGSRGLGEVTAKIIAAGGGAVQITYRAGAQEAHQVIDELREHGASADFCQLDMANQDSDLKNELNLSWSPNYLYYYATPRISLGDRLEFLPSLFNAYCDVYVSGFYRLVDALMANYDGRLLRILYPSSTTLEEILPRASEYASAKAAGEMLCQHLEQTNPDLEISVVRFPRVTTDQTNSLLSVPADNPLEVLLPALRGMYSGATT